MKRRAKTTKMVRRARGATATPAKRRPQAGAEVAGSIKILQKNGRSYTFEVRRVPTGNAVNGTMRVPKVELVPGFVEIVDLDAGFRWSIPTDDIRWVEERDTYGRT